MAILRYIIRCLIIFLSISATSWADSTASMNQGNITTDHLRRHIITIQVSSHKDAADAQREMDRLKPLGLEAFVDYEPVKDKGMWHRIYIGQFDSREAARSFAQDLVDRGVISGYWVKKKEVLLEVKPKKEATITSKAPPPPPIQPRPTDVVESSQPPPTKEAHPPEIKKITPEKADKTEAHAKAPVKTDTLKQNKSRLSLGVKSTVLASSMAEQFKVTKSDGATTETWSFGETYIWFGLVGNYRLNDKLSIEASIEKDVVEKIDNWLLTFGVKYELQSISWVTLYLRGGGIVGRLNWDDMPGDFDTGFGLDGGIGLQRTWSKFRLGLEASYRYMKYNYNPPADDDITLNDDHLNMSGLALSGTLSYLF